MKASIWIIAGLMGCACASQAPESKDPSDSEASSVEETDSAAEASNETSASDEKESAAEEEAQAAEDKTEAKTGAQASDDERCVETRTAEVMQQLVRTKKDAVKECYNAARKQSPGLKGTLTVNFTLDPDGKISKLASDPAKTDLPQIEECALPLLKTLAFPESECGVESRFAYQFSYNTDK